MSSSNLGGIIALSALAMSSQDFQPPTPRRWPIKEEYDIFDILYGSAGANNGINAGPLPDLFDNRTKTPTGRLLTRPKPSWVKDKPVVKEEHPNKRQRQARKNQRKGK